MKKSEWITLLVGIAIIVFLAWTAGIFKLFSTNNQSTTQTAMNTSTPTPQGIPPVQGTNISSDPKLQIIDVQVGTGTVAKSGSHISVNYTGMLSDGTVFDSSIPRGKTFDFVLNQGTVIKGWDLGLQGMKVGGKRRLIIAPEYGYGAAGYPPVIPQNATLTFDVEMVSVK